MPEGPSRRRIYWALGALVLGLWVVVDLLPGWFPGAARLPVGERERDSRIGYEMRYNAGWLTAYYREHGALPASLPTNRAAAGNAAVIELCPTHPRDLVSDQADWALCATDRAVRALASNKDHVVGLEVPQKIELFPR
jgi:hypothetical protein